MNEGINTVYEVINVTCLAIISTQLSSSSKDAFLLNSFYTNNMTEQPRYGFVKDV